MVDLRLREAHERFEQARRYRVLVDTVRALLESRMTRAQAKAWTRELWPPDSGQGGPLRSGIAATVFDSLWNIEERDERGDVVREVDLRAYLDWLMRGDCFLGDDQPLLLLEGDIDEFGKQLGVTPFRHWVDGLGWFLGLRFCATATERPFVARMGEGPGGPSTIHRVIEIYKQRSDPWHNAVIDLFETLAIDERDVGWMNPAVELEQLPRWALWREDDNANQFEIDRFRSYSKAIAQERMYTARGHRQFYWVDSAS